MDDLLRVYLSPDDAGGGGEDNEEEKDVEEPAKIKIGDEEYTPEEILEFKKGYMRQSDYTRKTQELAEQRKGLSKSNDDPIKHSSNKDIEDLRLEMSLNRELDAIDKDVNEVMGMKRCDIFKTFEEDVKEISSTHHVMPKAALDIFVANNLEKIKSTADKLKKKSGADSTRREDAQIDNSNKRGGDVAPTEIKKLPGETLHQLSERIAKLKKG